MADKGLNLSPSSLYQFLRVPKGKELAEKEGGTQEHQDRKRGYWNRGRPPGQKEGLSGHGEELAEWKEWPSGHWEELAGPKEGLSGHGRS